MTVQGALLFARYAYPPNELGYCGPDGAGALLRPEEPAEIERRARLFDGAWSYLEAIARACGVADPLDAAVVEAYWVGNELLDRVPPGELLAWLRERFADQPFGTWRTAAGRARAHHSFQVFEVYPWAVLLQRTGNPAALSALDRCRIRTGTVVSVDGEHARVRSRPLIWQSGVLSPGPVVEEVAAWSAGGRSLLPGLSPGDLVTLHWDWVCDIITDEQRARIESLEADAIGAVPSLQRSA
jgi:hypothetical protein